jgi:hypothetical protein
MALKKYLKITSPVKHLEIYSMAHEENEEIKNELSKLNDRSMKNVI